MYSSSRQLTYMQYLDHLVSVLSLSSSCTCTDPLRACNPTLLSQHRALAFLPRILMTIPGANACKFAGASPKTWSCLTLACELSYVLSPSTAWGPHWGPGVPKLLHMWPGFTFKLRIPSHFDFAGPPSLRGPHNPMLATNTSCHLLSQVLLYLTCACPHRHS